MTLSLNRAALSDWWIFQTKPVLHGGSFSINEGPLQAHAFLPCTERGRISPSATNKRTLCCGLYERARGRLMERLHLSAHRYCLPSPTIAWPVTHLPFDWTAAAMSVCRRCQSSQKSHLSLPWQIILQLSSTDKQSCLINRIQAGPLFLGYSNCSE